MRLFRQYNQQEPDFIKVIEASDWEDEVRQFRQRILDSARDLLASDPTATLSEFPEILFTTEGEGEDERYINEFRTTEYDEVMQSNT